MNLQNLVQRTSNSLKKLKHKHFSYEEGRQDVVHLENWIHEEILHYAVIKKDSPYHHLKPVVSFHWAEKTKDGKKVGHHKSARRFGFYDPTYDLAPLAIDFSQSSSGITPHGKEYLMIQAASKSLVIPQTLAKLVKQKKIEEYLQGIRDGGTHYYETHRRSHMDSGWCRENLMFHYVHHMGNEPHANWGVTDDTYDRINGTLSDYQCSKSEITDHIKREKAATSPRERKKRDKERRFANANIRKEICSKLPSYLDLPAEYLMIFTQKALEKIGKDGPSFMKQYAS